MRSRTLRAVVIALAAGALAAATALLVVRPWQGSTSEPGAASPSDNPGIVATLPEPTATGPNGLPLIPSDPFMPPPSQGQPPQQPTGSPAPPSPMPAPPTYATIPAVPSPPAIPSSAATPTPPDRPGRIECQAWLEPAPVAGRDAVRLVVRSAPSVRMVWARVSSPTGSQSGSVGLLNGYGSQVIPGAPLVGSSVVVYADQAMTSASESCRAG